MAKQEFNPGTLTVSEQEDVLEFCNSKHFETLRRLVEVVDYHATSDLKNKATTPRMRQFYAGQCDGAVQVILTALNIKSIIKKS
jgi:predicted house-cleaning noncanonical NTP pyrophosphatase (MazG superfamily)